MNSDGHYLEGVEGTLPLPGTTTPDTHWKQLVADRQASPLLVDEPFEPYDEDDEECTVCSILGHENGCADEPDETNPLEIQTFTITRVVEFDGLEAIDWGLTIEFYGSDGPIQTVALNSPVATALRDALQRAVV